MPNLSLWTEQLFCLPTVENIHPFASIGAQFLLRESQRSRTVITTVLETLCRRNRWLYPAHTVRTAIRCTIATNSRPLDGFRPTPVGPSISVAICRLVFTNSGGSERSLDVKRANRKLRKLQNSAAFFQDLTKRATAKCSAEYQERQLRPSEGTPQTV